jgi:hypothetical protein
MHLRHQSGTGGREPRLQAGGTICSSQTKVSLARAGDVEGGTLNGCCGAQCSVSIEHAASSSLRVTSWPRVVAIVSTGSDSSPVIVGVWGRQTAAYADRPRRDWRQAALAAAAGASLVTVFQGGARLHAAGSNSSEAMTILYTWGWRRDETARRHLKRSALKP